MSFKCCLKKIHLDMKKLIKWKKKSLTHVTIVPVKISFTKLNLINFKFNINYVKKNIKC